METVAILGLGYVGFPLAELLVKSKKYKVIGLDISPSTVVRARKNLKAKNFLATGDFTKLWKADISVVCVPTPTFRNFQPDYGPVKNACLSIIKNLKPGQLVIIESTVNPGTCEEVVLPILERYGAIAGKDFLLAHCPERIDPGNKKWTLVNIPRNVGGLDAESTKRSAEFYRSFLKSEVKVMSCLKAAEATKIIENTFRDINIAYVNELAMSFDAMDIDLVEVIGGAKTKPFAFMPHYPGVGVGGHCFEKNQIVFLKTESGIETVTVKELYECIERSGRFSSAEILSFDIERKKSCFKKILFIMRRPSKNVIRIRTQFGYELKVTEKHPIVVYRDGEMTTCFAEDIKIGDLLVINTSLPAFQKEFTIDTLENFQNAREPSKIRVGLKKDKWTKWRKALAPLLNGNRRALDNYYRYNFLPLSVFQEAEKRALIGPLRKEILLRTGRGPSSLSIPAVLKVNDDFCRLIGYYLSEGCLTKDKSLRTRFCFNSSEHEYLRDVRNILRKKGITFSEYHSKQWRSSYIKVSSNIFGSVIKDTLNCGANCYSMTIPSQFLAFSQHKRREVVKGLLRGDGGVTMTEGKRFYKKNGRDYFHESNSVDVNFFSSSKKLFQQMVLLLLDQGIFPRIQKREGLLLISDNSDVKKMIDYFDGEKRLRIIRGLANKKKFINRDKHFRQQKTFYLAPVTSMETLPTDVVYSLEVADTHTVVTSYGIVVHNCIPVDPYYLIEHALKSGFEHRFLEMARTVNNGMPAYTVSLLEKELGKLGLRLSRVTVGLLGLAYKPNVADVRESPALKVLKILKEKRTKVEIFDPFIPKRSTTKSLQALLKKCEVIVLATAHSDFRTLSPKSLKKAGVKLVIDGRNCLAKEEILAAGVAYKGIGH